MLVNPLIILLLAMDMGELGMVIMAIALVDLVASMVVMVVLIALVATMVVMFSHVSCVGKLAMVPKPAGPCQIFKRTLPHLLLLSVSIVGGTAHVSVSSDTNMISDTSSPSVSDCAVPSPSAFDSNVHTSIMFNETDGQVQVQSEPGVGICCYHFISVAHYR
jgi:hypothetical protein